MKLTELARLDISAASGLVAWGDALHVVADDEHELCTYGRDGSPRRRLKLFEPATEKSRKADLEALAMLFPDTLLALGSGSTERRCRGAAIRGDDVRLLDLAPLYRGLELAELNIEGAAARGDRLILLQRGNAGQNAVIELDLEGVRRAVSDGTSLSPSLVREVRRVELGALDGVALGFTDATPLDENTLLYVAAAEAGGSTYEDGPVAGSVIGLVGGGWLRLETRDKIEGIHAHLDGDRVDLLLVADPDDRGQRAPLYSASVSLEQLRRA